MNLEAKPLGVCGLGPLHPLILPVDPWQSWTLPGSLRTESVSQPFTERSVPKETQVPVEWLLFS